MKLGRKLLALTGNLLSLLALSNAKVLKPAKAGCGPPYFACSRSDSNVTQPDAVPRLNFGGLHGAGSLFRDPLYNDIEILRCTDAYTNPAHLNASYTVGLGGAGDRTSWNLNDTLLQITDTSGTPLIFRFDPAAKSCRPVCVDGGADPHCSGSSLYITRPGVFSKVDPYKYYAFPSAAAPGTKVVAIMLRPGMPPSQPTAVADFAPALYKGANPEWRPNARIELGDVIEPKKNNDAGFELFQATGTGTTGKDQPSWTNAVEPYRSKNHTPLPLPEWPGAGKEVITQTKIQPALTRNAGKFIFRSIVNGKTASTEPTWCQVPGCQVDDGDVTWMNMSASSSIQDGSVTWTKIGRTGTETWVSVAGVESGDHVFGVGISYSRPDSAQDTGVWALVYDDANNRIYQLNTYTRIETDFVCSGGTGYDCKGGAWKRERSRQISSEDYITVHNTVLSLDGRSLDVICGAFAGPCHSVNKLWHPGTATWDEVLVDGDGHSLIGYAHFVNSGAGAGADGPTQKYFSIRPNNNTAAVSAFWKVSPCTNLAEFRMEVRRPYPTPPCYPQIDHHFSWVYNLGRDEEPIIGASFITGNGYPAVSPWQYEIVGISSCGREGEDACPRNYPNNTVWRFGRTFNFNYKPGIGNFFALGSIGAVAQTGRYYALTSMGLGTMGSVKGDPNCHQGFSWAKSFEYANGSQITPYTHNDANLTFSAHCAEACTSGVTEPQWPQDGKTSIEDGHITWVPVGVANCRSDVLIYKLQ
jgi:hypothetical protein